MVRAARAARPARLVRADRPQRRPEPRLVDLRADHHLDRGERRSRSASSASASAGSGRCSSARSRSRSGCSGPIGFVRRYLKQVRRLGGRGLDRLPDLVGRSTRPNLHALWHQPGTGGVTIGQGIDLVIANIVSWTPLAADYTRFARDRRSALLRRRRRLPRCRRSGASGSASLLVLSRDLERADADPDRGRHRQRARACSRCCADRRRERRGVRRHLLDGGLAAEPAPGGLAAAADRARRGRRRPPARS